MSWIPPTTFPPALTEVLGVTLTIGWLALLFNMRGAHRLRSVFEEGEARNRAYLAERIANMEIKGRVTLRLKPS